MDTLSIILSVAGAVSVIGGAGAMVYKWIAPAIKIAARMAELERRSGNDFTRLNDIEGVIQAQQRIILQLINHAIDGNGVERMKILREEYQNKILGG